MNHFTRMDEPYVYGYETERDNGLTVEIVRCYEGEWNVFLTRDKTVVARSIAEYRECGNGFVSKTRAFEIARELSAKGGEL